ncbi:hypothetical protein ATANTOWER_021017 [Ataeniobius toweri]|uniref:Uncharacterized protein n=1 Tax=Ataeniobius toweri TaxID=208326 RepID=A0ABU7BAE4_9TELE|nr:hypothetical protein [Ataeniobius toweri]
MAAERSFSDSFIDEDPQKALEALNEALQEGCDNVEWLCQRAYAQILLKNYSNAVDDAKKAQQLNPSLPLAFMRTGCVEENSGSVCDYLMIQIKLALCKAVKETTMVSSLS